MRTIRESVLGETRSAIAELKRRRGDESSGRLRKRAWGVLFFWGANQEQIHLDTFRISTATDTLALG